MSVNMGGMRGVVAADASSVGEIGFIFRGPSKTTAPLGNGELRRQIGLKLHAQDTCNAIYVMWRIEPTPGVAVSVKRNPGKTRHAQCLDQGYVNLGPRSGAPVLPVVRVGERHSLRAELAGTTLRVIADGVVRWEGPLPPEAFAVQGPVGVRSDNGEFEFELRVPEGGAPNATCAGVVRD